MPIQKIEFNHKNSNQAEFEIIELSSLLSRQDLDHDPQISHRVSFFMFICIEAGQGTHMVDFEEYPFEAGSMIFVQREQVHRFDLSSNPQGKILLFTQAFLDRLHSNMRLPDYTPTHLNAAHSPLAKMNELDRKRTRTLIAEMIIEQQHENSDPLIVMYIFSALALIFHRLRPESIHGKLTEKQNVCLARFFELMQQHFSRVRDANWYAHQLNITYKTLNQVCKLSTGLTAKQMIDAFTVVEMKRCIVVNSLSSQQMAYDFGFEDASNFVKYFKNLTGLTPTQFQTNYGKPVL